MRAHYEETGSPRALYVLEHLDEAMQKMWAVVPESEQTNPILAEEGAAANVALKEASSV